MTDSANKWSELKERGGVFTLRLMLMIYRYGGRSLCQGVLYVVILWYWLFSRRARQASLEYLQRVHQFAAAQSPFARKPNWLHSYRHLMHFGECILDKISAWLGHFTERDLQLNGHEHFQQHYQKGAIILVSHFGNIDLLRAIKSEHVQKINVLVFQKHATQFNAFLRTINDRVDLQLLAVDELGMDTALLLQEKIQQGEWIVIAADRVPVQSDRVQQLSFLGAEAAWPQGAWVLAQLLHVPVLAVFCYRVQHNFHVQIHKITDQFNAPRADRLRSMQRFMQCYVQLMEGYCLRAPYQWFNFYHFWNK
ncbi:putative LPLAT superfamily acyltransferase [Acinetobacter calcoaceticus]|uniref:Putative LPLAT superfamily acyltransferase n=1 Tax=Acinetobacter calcoaceticus TaxID=471 RepID=A0A4R1XGZ5_ACICA|nr:putative LPLAT superfamily acyltransferase [Acinetobacter calcoaceticus]